MRFIRRIQIRLATNAAATQQIKSKTFRKIFHSVYLAQYLFDFVMRNERSVVIFFAFSIIYFVRYTKWRSDAFLLNSVDNILSPVFLLSKRRTFTITLHFMIHPIIFCLFIFCRSILHWIFPLFFIRFNAVITIKCNSMSCKQTHASTINKTKLRWILI